MRDQTKSIPHALPQSLGERIVLAVLCLFIAPMSGRVLLWMLTAPPRQGDVWDSVLQAFMFEFALGLFVACTVGLVWALLAPKWAEQLLTVVSYHLTMVFWLTVGLAIAAPLVVAIVQGVP